MNINTAFPSKYLKAADLGDASPVVTISRVAMEAVGVGKDVKPIAYFEGKSKGMVLNKVNSKTIATIADSPETDDWTGTRIQLFVAQVDFQGEQVDALRVRAPRSNNKPAPVKPKTEPIPDIDVDFGAADDNPPF